MTVTRRIDRLARELRRAGETRTIDQLRADLLVDLLTRGVQDPGDRRWLTSTSISTRARSCLSRPAN